MSRRDQLPLSRRVARLGFVATALFGVALVLVAVAILFALDLHPRGRTGNLPLASTDRIPSVSILLAVLAAAAGSVVVVAALHVAAAMRVLARDPRIPGHPATETPQPRSSRLTSIVRLLVPHEPPPSKLPHPTDLLDEPLHLTVLVPAYNETHTIGGCLDSLYRQTRPPDRVIVVCDNCTDDTAEIAEARGAEVFNTVDNAEKKAGALNQVLSELLDEVDTHEVTMVMDADSIVAPEFVEVAMGRLEADPDLIAVGGVFSGEPGCGLVGLLQRNEYTRYRRHIARRGGKVFVLTGTASMFRSYALQAVADSRGELIPGDPGQVYDTLAMTEDNEMTLALKSLGAKMVSPMQCVVMTEVMHDLRSLWRQRMRWQRGALENIGAYGPTRATFRYWMQQVGIGYGTIALNAYLLLMLITVLAADNFAVLWFWSAIGMVFVIERVVTVWPSGWAARLIAAPLVIELVYAIFLQAVYVTSLLEIASGRAAGWNHVPRHHRQAVAD